VSRATLWLVVVSCGAGLPSAVAQGDDARTSGQTRVSDEASGAPDSRARLAVGGFRCAAGVDERDAWMSAAVEETLSWRLRRVGSLITIPIDRIIAAQMELGQERPEPPDVVPVAELLGAQHLLTGESAGTPDALALRLRLVDPAEASAAPLTGELSPMRLMDAIDAATTWILERGVDPPDEPTRLRVFERPSRSPTALEYFVKSLAAFRGARPADAYRYAQEAVSYDDRYRPALFLLTRYELRAGPSAIPSVQRRLGVLAELARQSGDALDLAEVELLRGMLMHSQGEFGPALLRMQNALAIAYENRDLYGQLNATNGICDLYLTRELREEIGVPAEQRHRFNYQTLNQGAEWHEVVLDLLHTLNDRVTEGPVATKLALIHDKLGNADEARALYQRSLALAEQCGSIRNQVSSLMFLGQWHRRQGQLVEALAATSRSLALAPEPLRPPVRVALAELHEAMGQPSDALGQYELAYEQLKRGEDLNSQFVCLRRMAELRMQLGQRGAAIASLREALDIAHVLKLPEKAELETRLQNWIAGK
jgi:tetratricopeptide (TPR) repeat protein